MRELRKMYRDMDTDGDKKISRDELVNFDGENLDEDKIIDQLNFLEDGLESSEDMLGFQNEIAQLKQTVLKNSFYGDGKLKSLLEEYDYVPKIDLNDKKIQLEISESMILIEKKYMYLFYVTDLLTNLFSQLLLGDPKSKHTKDGLARLEGLKKRVLPLDDLVDELQNILESDLMIMQNVDFMATDYERLGGQNNSDLKRGGDRTFVELLVGIADAENEDEVMANFVEIASLLKPMGLGRSYLVEKQLRGMLLGKEEINQIDNGRVGAILFMTEQNLTNNPKDLISLFEKIDSGLDNEEKHIDVFLKKMLGVGDDFDDISQYPEYFESVPDISLWDSIVDKKPELVEKMRDMVIKLSKKYETIVDGTAAKIKKTLKKENPTWSKKELKAEARKQAKIAVEIEMLDLFYKEMIFEVFSAYKSEIDVIAENDPVLDLYKDIVGIGVMNFSDETENIIETSVEGAFAIFMAMRMGGTRMVGNVGKFLKLWTGSRIISGVGAFAVEGAAVHYMGEGWRLAMFGNVTDRVNRNPTGTYVFIGSMKIAMSLTQLTKYLGINVGKTLVPDRVLANISKKLEQSSFSKEVLKMADQSLNVGFEVVSFAGTKILIKSMTKGEYVGLTDEDWIDIFAFIGTMKVSGVSTKIIVNGYDKTTRTVKLFVEGQKKEISLILKDIKLGNDYVNKNNGDVTSKKVKDKKVSVSDALYSYDNIQKIRLEETVKTLDEIVPRDQSWQNIIFAENGKLTEIGSVLIMVNNIKGDTKNTFSVRKEKTEMLRKVGFSFAEIRVLFDNNLCNKALTLKNINSELDLFDKDYANLSTQSRIGWLEYLLKEVIVLGDRKLEWKIKEKLLLEKKNLLEENFDAESIYQEMLESAEVMDHMFYRSLFFVGLDVFGSSLVDAKIIEGINFTNIEFYAKNDGQKTMFMVTVAETKQGGRNIVDFRFFNEKLEEISHTGLDDLGIPMVMSFNRKYSESIEPTYMDLDASDYNVFLEGSGYSVKDVEKSYVDKNKSEFVFVVKGKEYRIGLSLLDQYLAEATIQPDVEINKLLRKKLIRTYSDLVDFSKFEDLVIDEFILMSETVLDVNKSSAVDYEKFSDEQLSVAVKLLYKEMYSCDLSTKKGAEMYEFWKIRLNLIEKDVIKNRKIEKIQSLKINEDILSIYDINVKNINVEDISSLEGLARIFEVTLVDGIKYDLFLEKYFLYTLKYSFDKDLSFPEKLKVEQRILSINNQLAIFSKEGKMSKKHPEGYDLEYLDKIKSNPEKLAEFKSYLYEGFDASALIHSAKLLVSEGILTKTEFMEYTLNKSKNSPSELILAISTLIHKSSNIRGKNASIAKEKLDYLKDVFNKKMLLEKVNFSDDSNPYNLLFIALYSKEIDSDFVNIEGLDLKQLNIAFDKNNFEQSNKIINVCGSGEDIFTLSLETGNVISLKSETGEVVALVKTTHQSSDIRKKGTKYTIVFKENYQLSNGQILYKNAFYSFGGETMKMIKGKSDAESTSFNLKYLRPQISPMTDVFFDYFKYHEDGMEGGSFEISKNGLLLNNKKQNLDKKTNDNDRRNYKK